jgi:cytochrome c oxidase subunit 3
MKTGSIDIIDEIEKEPKRRRATLSGGKGNGNNRGGRDPGGGGDRPNNDDIRDAEHQTPSKDRIVTAFLLLIVMMTFGGLISAYVVIATNNVAEWHPFSLPFQVWISTALILASSITFQVAKSATDRDEQIRARKWFIATAALGGAFISSQLIVWLELRARGLYVYGNPYAGFFYILTAIHAVHVLGGITALGSLLLRSWYPTSDLEQISRRKSFATVVGWYWHFMGVLWIVLFVLLGFWK